MRGGAPVGFAELETERNRLLITSIRRGSVVITGTILVGFAWAFKKFVEPSWDKSDTKKKWDRLVTTQIDFYFDKLRDHIEKAWGRTSWLRITRLYVDRGEDGNKLTMQMDENPFMKDPRPKE